MIDPFGNSTKNKPFTGSIPIPAQEKVHPDIVSGGSSKNYYPLKRGWILKPDGYAEFNESNMGIFQVSVSPGNNIQNAIDMVSKAGGGKVFIRNGTHLLNYDLVLSSNIILEGETPFGAILDFQNQNHSITAYGSDTYSTGTVSVTIGTTTVTGSGTNWKQVMVGRSIFLGGIWYGIVSVDTPTQITIDSQYTSTGTYGNLSGASYTIATLNNGCILRNFVVQNADYALDVQYCLYMVVDYFNIYSCNYFINSNYLGGMTLNNSGGIGCNYGIYVNNSTSFSILSTSVYNSVLGDGINFQNSGDSTIFNVSASNNAGNGITLNNAWNSAYISLSVNDNTAKGVEMVSNANDNSFNNIAISGNGSDGIKLTATSSRNYFSVNSVISNGGYGINVANSNCNNNIILGNNFASNTSGQSHDLGTGTKIRSNIGVADN